MPDGYGRKVDQVALAILQRHVSVHTKNQKNKKIKVT